MQNLRQRFSSIVAHVAAGTLCMSGCTITTANFKKEGGGGGGSGVKCHQAEDMSLFRVESGTRPQEEILSASLREIEAAEPDAGPERKLRALYGPQGVFSKRNTSPIFNETARMLVLEASGDSGAIPKELCELLCMSLVQDRSESKPGRLKVSCRLTTNASPEDALVCNIPRFYCEGPHPAGRRFEGMLPEGEVEGEELGRAWARIAFSEHTAIHAFALLGAELAHHGAPAALVRRCTEAMCDEVEHALATQRLAFAHGVTRLSPVSAPAPCPPRGLLEIALENAAEGCVREAYAALETRWQSRHAADPQARSVFARISDDETGHAELSWDLHSWLMSQLSSSERAQVEGVLLKGVKENGPAHMGGMRAGDIIVQIGDHPIADVQGYADALDTLSAGETILVVVMRDGERALLRVTVGEREQ